MAKNQMRRVLDDPFKRADEPYGVNGVLASFFRKILHDLNITPMKWHILMTDFLDDMHRRLGVPDNRKDRTSMRGNLIKEFFRLQMTWKVFIKGLRFLQIYKIEIVIKAYHESGKTTVHMKEVELGSRKDNNLNEFLEAVDRPDSETDVDEAPPHPDDEVET